MQHHVPTRFFREKVFFVRSSRRIFFLMRRVFVYVEDLIQSLPLLSARRIEEWKGGKKQRRTSGYHLCLSSERRTRVSIGRSFRRRLRAYCRLISNRRPAYALAFTGTHWILPSYWLLAILDAESPSPPAAAGASTCRGLRERRKPRRRIAGRLAPSIDRPPPPPPAAEEEAIDEISNVAPKASVQVRTRPEPDGVSLRRRRRRRRRLRRQPSRSS